MNEICLFCAHGTKADGNNFRCAIDKKIHPYNDWCKKFEPKDTLSAKKETSKSYQSLYDKEEIQIEKPLLAPIIAWLHIIGGGLFFLIRFFAWGNVLMFYLLLWLICGLVIASGIGLLKWQNWARIVAIICYSFGILYELKDIQRCIRMAAGVYTVWPQTYGAAIFAILILALLIYYFSRADVRSASSSKGT